MFVRWVAAVVLLAGGCGDNAPFGAIGFVAIDDLYVKQKLAFCRHAAACGLVDDPRTCLARNTGPRGLVDPTLIAAVDDGSVRYDGDAAGRCLEARARWTCDATDEDGRAPDENCLVALAGTVAEGGACAIDAQCESQRCELAPCPEACCAGTCLGPPVDPRLHAIGSACASTSVCVAGSYCAPSATCEALLVDGSPCSAASECAYGLGCAGSPPTCKVLPAIGEACPDLKCGDEGTYCDRVTLACTQLGLPGDPCEHSEACSPLYACDLAAGRCHDGADFGEPCASSLQCASASTYCDPMTGTCTERKPEGAACASADECANASCLGTCAPPASCI